MSERETSAGGGGLLTGWLAALGRLVLEKPRGLFGLLGGMFLLLAATARWVLKGLVQPAVRPKPEALAFQMVRVGVRAIAIVVLVQATIGIILPLQMFPQLDKYGQGDQVATINAIAAVRELGPLMTAIVLSGFAGASIAAELGTMVTAEEIEALQAMALNPVRFLVVPRILATVIMTLLLSIVAVVVMIFGGWLTSLQLGLDSGVYYQLTVEAVDLTGFATGVVKSGVFGMLVGLIGCYLGLSVRPWEGSEGVGRATTQTVVFSIVAIIGADAIFTVIFYAHGLFS